MSKIIRDNIPPYVFLTPILKDLTLQIKSPVKKIFMLRCEGSLLLAKAAILGYEISGISEDRQHLDDLKEFCEKEHLSYGQLIHASIDNYDVASLENKYDLLFSSGLLIRIQQPEQIVYKWAKVVKPGGLVLNCGPNCQSVNGKILKKFDPQFWKTLTPFSTESFDKMHLDAKLKVKRASYYDRGFDIHMLTPWNSIREKCINNTLFRIIKYFATIIEMIIKPFVKKGNRHFNSFIIGIYEK